jgi:hypothetical protein
MHNIYEYVDFFIIKLEVEFLRKEKFFYVFIKKNEKEDFLYL